MAWFASVMPLAQTSGTITGTVSDQSGAAVPQAKVLALNANTAERRETNASASGQYSFPFLAPGEYRIEVSATSAAKAVLGVTERIAVDVVLKPGGCQRKDRGDGCGAIAADGVRRVGARGGRECGEGIAVIVAQFYLAVGVVAGHVGSLELLQCPIVSGSCEKH